MSWGKRLHVADATPLLYDAKTELKSFNNGIDVAPFILISEELP